MLKYLRHLIGLNIAAKLTNIAVTALQGHQWEVFSLSIWVTYFLMAIQYALIREKTLTAYAWKGSALHNLTNGVKIFAARLISIYQHLTIMHELEYL